jgi:glycosyltransferase involved in cell wall biosynthesis
MKFLVVTNAPTFKTDGKFVAYAPYINEMDIWFENVKEVGIISPAKYPEIVYVKAFDRQDIKFFKLPFLKLSNPFQILRFLLFIPLLKIKIIRSFIWADHIHLRCPGNIGLIASMLQIVFPGRPKTVKYAGNWDPNSKQPWSYRLQKWILSNTFLSRNIKVLVYGEWPEQSKNILPFFTASFSEVEKAVVNKNFTSPFKFIFVGNLSAGKRPLFAIKLIEALMGKGIPVKLEIYGSGVLKNELQEYITTKNLDPFVRLMGNCELEELKEVYKASHFLILASQSEGWPKAVAEAMFFGCIPVATGVSCVPWMLGDGSRGILAPSAPEGGVDEKEWIENLVNRIIELIKDPEQMKRKSFAGQEWSQQYTLEKFESEIKKLL